MAMSKAMKATLLCVVLVLSVMTTTVVSGDHEDGKGMHYYEKGGGGGGGHDGFSIKTHHKPVNPYSRGCSRITRCRGGSRKLL
ncbi:hypothetical protein K1719_036681 [Acacia pycnantha]|nr:hypothetical protein K1719_042504 [Acacia pycnantha]KAI9081340.1 hypothetical protein K1719_036681 [Acacia pycnantha]